MHSFHVCVQVCFSTGFHVLDLFPDLTLCSAIRKDTTGCEDRLGFSLCVLACVFVVRALQPTSALVTAKPPSQDGDCVRNVRGRDHLVAACPSAHEQKPGGLCHQWARNKTFSGKGPSLCHKSASREPGRLSSSGMIYSKACRVTS